MKNQFYFIFVGLLIISSCNKKLDATSERTLWASAETIANSMRDGDKEEFVKAFDAVGHHYLFKVDSEDEMRKIFHNKTAKQIIKLAKEIEAEKLASQLRIDASSINAFLISRENAERALSWDDKLDFEEAIEIIASTYSARASEKKLLARFHNKTPAEIISEASKVKGEKINSMPKKKPWD